MKTTNALYISVILHDDVITTARHFDFDEAKDTMIHMMTGVFNMAKDDAIIYESIDNGEAKPIFNFRAYLNNEEQPAPKHAKENKFIKIFFECSDCKSSLYKLGVDDDLDVVAFCKQCDKPHHIV